MTTNELKECASKTWDLMKEAVDMTDPGLSEYDKERIVKNNLCSIMYWLVKVKPEYYIEHMKWVSELEED